MKLARLVVQGRTDATSPLLFSSTRTVSSHRERIAVLEENSAAGRKRVPDALTALHRYSLASVDGNQVSVHRLLQKVIRDRLTGPDQASAITHALTAIQRALPMIRSFRQVAAVARTGSPHRRPRQHRGRRQPQCWPAREHTEPDVRFPAPVRVQPSGPGPGYSSGLSRQPTSAPTTPTSSSPGLSWPSRTGRRGAPAMPLP